MNDLHIDKTHWGNATTNLLIAKKCKTQYIKTMNTFKNHKAMFFHPTLIIDRDVGKKNKTLETGARLPRV